MTISNLAGDLGDDEEERWSIFLGAKKLGETNNSNEDCAPASGSVFPVTLADLLAAKTGDTIRVSIVNGGDIQAFCQSEDGGNTMDITLAFPGLLTT